MMLDHHRALVSEIKRRREKARFSQRELGQIAGCSRSMIAQIETLRKPVPASLVGPLLVSLRLMEAWDREERKAVHAREAAQGLHI